MAASSGCTFEQRSLIVDRTKDMAIVSGYKVYTREVDDILYDHPATAKLQDILVAILAGCRSLAQVNTRVRPEHGLATAWGRPAFAEQSTLSRTLDALQAEHLSQLRSGQLALLQQHSQLRQHNWTQPVILDIDPTSLVTAKRAEGSRKGWVSGQPNAYCRHVIRFTLAGYHESLLSVAYPGDRHGYEYCKPAMQQLLGAWPSAPGMPSVVSGKM